MGIGESKPVLDEYLPIPNLLTEISTFDKWTAIKRPALPRRIDREMVDVIAVVEDGLRVLNDSDEISLGKLLE